MYVPGPQPKRGRSLNILSGETFLESGKSKSIKVLWPNHKAWNALSKIDERLAEQDLVMIDCGYGQMNKVDWGYIK